MTDAPEPTPDRLTVEIDGCEVMVLIAENAYGHPRPPGVANGVLIEGLPPQVREQLLAATKAVIGYICDAWGEALSAGGGEVTRTELVTQGRAH